MEAHRRAGRGGIEGLGVQVGKDRFQQALQIALALRQPLAEVAHLPAALLQQGHQGRLVGRLGQHLNQHAATAAHAVAVYLLAYKHCRGGLLGVQQVGGEIVADAAAHQFHRGAEWFAFAQVAHHVQVAGAAGAAEVEVGQAVGARHRVQLQGRVAHIAAHGAVAARVHHQAPQWAIRLDAQVDAAMGHLHRAGQQEPGRHGAA